MTPQTELGGAVHSPLGSQPRRDGALPALGLLCVVAVVMPMLLPAPTDLSPAALLRLPTAARDITELGAGYHTFRLELDGVDRLFLRGPGGDLTELESGDPCRKSSWQPGP
jgi:hypothetical protein